jgi:PAP2 superfamily
VQSPGSEPNPPSEPRAATLDSEFIKYGLSALLLTTVLGLCASRGFYTSSMQSIYLSLAIASALIVLVILRRSWIDLLLVSAGPLILMRLDYRVMKFPSSPMSIFSFLGMAALLVLGIRAIWARGEDRRLLFWGFSSCVLFIAPEYMAGALLNITEALHHKTFDLYLYSFDCSLHIQLSFLLGQIFARHFWLHEACFLIYIALPLPLALVYAAQLRRKSDTASQTLLAFLATGPLGVLFYNMLPACGPVHLLQNFPWYPLSTSAAAHMPVFTVPIPGARNAIPSLHMTWVLLVWWNSKDLPKWIRTIAMVFVIFTAMATLGTGEHYFIDLVVAFPFSLLVQSACSYSLPLRTGARRVAFLFGTFVTLFWFALLSFDTQLFWISPLLPWAMIVATVVPSVLLWHRLLDAKEKTEEPAARLMAVGASA